MSFITMNMRSQLEYRRRIRDHFATPAPITEALLQQETFEGLIWEPACGEGWMAEVLRQRGCDILATDLIDRGYGTGGMDFLKQTRPVPNIVTNPPYTDRLYITFPEHALKLATHKVAMLIPWFMCQSLAFQKLMFDAPLKAVYIFRKRVYTVAEGNKQGRRTTIPLAWFVWEHGHAGKPVLESIWPVEKRPVVSRLALRRTIHRQTVQSA